MSAGKMRIIRYTAGKDGFKAEGDIFQVSYESRVLYGIDPEFRVNITFEFHFPYSDVLRNYERTEDDTV